MVYILTAFLLFGFLCKIGGNAMWSGVRSKPLLLELSGGSWRRGGGTIKAVSVPPPNYGRLDVKTLIWAGGLKGVPTAL
jgi:hypothetical protein